MKTTFLTIALLITLRGLTQVIIYPIDFTIIKPKYKLTVPYESSIQIKVTNINRKVYSVEDEKSEEEFNVTLPDALKGIKLPPFIFNSPSPIPKTNGAAVPNASDERKWSKIDETIEKLISEIQERVNRINEAVLFYNQINHEVKNCTDSAPTIINSIVLTTLDFLYNDKTDPHPASDLAQRLKDTLHLQRKSAEESFNQLKKEIDSYSKGMKSAIEDRIKSIEIAIEEKRQDLQEEQNTSEIKKMKSDIEDRAKSLESYNAEKENIEEAIEKMNEKLETAKELVENLWEFEKDDKLYPIYTAFKIYTNRKNYEYYSVILNPDKDETKLILTITPQELNECTVADKKITEIKIRTINGIKLDVSTGAFVNIGNDNFLGNTFYYEKVNADTRKIVAASRNNNLMLSVGALLHVYKRSPAKVKLAGSVGVSTTADFTDLNFHAGPSLIVGDKNRFILTGGLTLKSSKVLDRQLKTEVTYNNDDTPDEIPTVTVFPRVGWFVGCTYNINILH